MKKIFSFAIVMAAAAMISCGGNANTSSTDVDETAAVEEATCCGEGGECCEKADSTCCGCCGEEAPAADAE